MPAPTNLTLLERCRCGTHLELDEEPHRGHIVTCPACFDPSADDASPIERLAGVGATPADAFANYMRLREERGLEPEEPEYRLSDLATFIVPPAPEGWALKRDSFPHKGAPFYYGPTPSQKAANQ